MEQRDPYFDNLKIILILLVVLGHYSANYPESKLLLGVYTFIYLFHIICALTAKKELIQNGQQKIQLYVR